jgi:3-oxoadipate enol-lactonase
VTLVLQSSLEGNPEGPALVLSSSLGTTHAMWDPQQERFASDLRLIRYDHPGHGGSPVPDAPVGIDDLGVALLALLDRSGIGRFSFCGISLGGCVGMWLAAHMPARIDRLVLACASPRFGSRESWLERAETVRAQGLEAVADATVDRWFTAGFAGAAQYRELLLATPAEGYARCCEALADFDARPYLGTIRAPTLVIAGAGDTSVSRDDLELLTGRIGNSRLVRLAPARHLASVEQPVAFADAVLQHLLGSSE